VRSVERNPSSRLTIASAAASAGSAISRRIAAATSGAAVLAVAVK
jgi:hypothetical protein